MKNVFSFCLILFFFYANAQVKGNKTIVTENYDISSFEEIYIGLVGSYEIDLQAEPSLEITMDENLFVHIEKSVSNNVLTFDQKKWVQPSTNVKIKIGGRGMMVLTQSAHSRTAMYNIDQEKITINGEVGDVTLQGRVDELAVTAGTGNVYANQLVAKNGVFNFDSWGRIEAKVSGNVTTVNNAGGKLVLNGTAARKKLIGTSEQKSIRFIKFVLKNNSANRHQFYVVGPKPDGSTFSYGFPMMPLQKRDKNWTNGTKVYKVNNLGLKKLVTEIKLSDEGQVVKIF